MRALSAWLHRELPPVPHLGRLDAAAVTIPCAAAVLLVFSQHHVRPANVSRLLAGRDLGAWGAIAPHLGWFAGDAVLFLLAPLLLLALLREPLREYGYGPGRARLGLAVAGALWVVMVPAVLVAARTPVFGAKYPLADGATASAGLFLVYEAAYGLYFVAWEALWRGFLLFGLYRRVGLPAIYVLALPFALEHHAKPEPEALGAVVAAIALGYLAIRTRSFWWGALLHAGVASTMDVAAGWGRLVR
ncbi:MAG: CPBP family intramembrane metalloprotease [Anaeromyxobacteraceae bacterium]